MVPRFFLNEQPRFKSDGDLITVELVSPRRFAFSVATCLLLLAPAGNSQSASRDISATFSAPGGCGSAVVLRERFEARVPELRMRFEKDTAVRFTIEETPSAVRARLLILLDEGGELSRTIEAENCDAAIEAIAFIAAVALDPGADDPLKLRTEDRLIPDKETPREVDQPAPPRQPARKRFWTASAFARANLGQAPDFIWGGGLGIENAADGSGLWAPSARLIAGHSRRGGFEREYGTARFDLTSVALDLCPSQTQGEIFRLQLCGTLEGGVLRAEGRDTYLPARSVRPWAGLGPSAAAEILILAPVRLSYRGAAIFPLIRDSFRFQETIFHEVPPVALELTMGVSVRFW